MIWYIDFENGANTNNGHSMAAPLKNFDKFQYVENQAPVLQHGDKILIKRGGELNLDDSYHKLYTANTGETVRDSVYVGTYGDGDKPKISCYKQVAKNDLTLYTGKIYSVDLSTTATGTSIANYNVGFIYDAEFDNIYGDRVFQLSDLTENMQFFVDDSILYIYIDDLDKIGGTLKLPIKCTLFNCDANMIIDGIEFTLGGEHGIATTADQGYWNIQIKNCYINKIGGSVQSGTTRLGNGFESYNIGKNIFVSDCIFEDIYDTGVTVQGTTANFENVSFTHNLFKRCNQAMENWASAGSTGYVSCSFSGNVCIKCGAGFGGVGRTNGYNVIFSNIASTNTDFEVKNNTLFMATDGVYYTANLTGKNIVFNDNTIYEYKNKKINYGYEFTVDNFDQYKTLVKQDQSSKFIPLDYEYKNSSIENSVLSASLFMDLLKNVYCHDTNKEVSNIGRYYITETRSGVTVSAYKVVEIEGMLIVRIRGLNTSEIPAYSQALKINMPGISFNEVDMCNNNLSTSIIPLAYPVTNGGLSLQFRQALPANQGFNVFGIIPLN